MLKLFILALQLSAFLVTLLFCKEVCNATTFESPDFRHCVSVSSLAAEHLPRSLIDAPFDARMLVSLEVTYESVDDVRTWISTIRSGHVGEDGLPSNHNGDVATQLQHNLCSVTSAHNNAEETSPNSKLLAEAVVCHHAGKRRISCVAPFAVVKNIFMAASASIVSMRSPLQLCVGNMHHSGGVKRHWTHPSMHSIPRSRHGHAGGELGVGAPMVKGSSVLLLLSGECLYVVGTVAHHVSPSDHPHHSQHVVAHLRQQLVHPKTTSSHENATKWRIEADGAGLVLLCCDVNTDDHHSVATDAAVCEVPSDTLDATFGQFPSLSHLEHLPRQSFQLKYSRGLMESGVPLHEPLTASLDAPGDSPNAGRVAGMGLRGKGYVVGVADTGIDTDHCFFHDASVDIPYNTVNHRHRKVVRYQTMGTDVNSKSDFLGGHGTHVTATIVGSVDAAKVAEFRESASSSKKDALLFHGVAPEAKVSFFDMTGSRPSTPQAVPFETMASLMASDGARVMSNSWGVERDFATYTASSASVDRYLHDVNADLTVLFAAGNDADVQCQSHPDIPLCDRFTLIYPSTAKNSLAVGASQGTQASWEHADLGTYELCVTKQSSDNTNVVCGFAVKGLAGPAFPQHVTASPIVVANPVDMCSGTLVNGIAVRGSILVALRGTCTFITKIRLASTLGAAALVVVNNIPGHGVVMPCADGESPSCEPISMNAFMINQTLGETIQAWASTEGVTLQGEITSRPGIAMPDRDPQTLSSFSSRGPTMDLRYKPDLVAVGELLHSARSDADLSSNNCDLFPSQGTSMATPLVAGYAVIVLEYLATLHTPLIVNPTSALVRAMLVQAAKPLAGRFERNFHGDWRALGEVPNFSEGHGFPVLNTTLPFVASSVPYAAASGGLFAMDTLEASQGSRHVFTVTFDDWAGSSVFEATLAWTDTADNSMVGSSRHPQLVNDLDLHVTHVATDVTYYGNGKGPLMPSRAGGVHWTADVLNTIEKVRVPNAQKGDVFLVTVDGSHVPSGVQRFAVVASGRGVWNVSMASCPTSTAYQSFGSGDVERLEPCGSRGVCSSRGICECETGWLGRACEIPVPHVLPGERIFVPSVAPMGWVLAAVPIPASCRLSLMSAARCGQVRTTATNHRPAMATINVALCNGGAPRHDDWALYPTSKCSAMDMTEDNTAVLTAAPTQRNVSKHLSIAVEERAPLVIAAVAPMCCYDTDITLSVDEGPSTNMAFLRKEHASMPAPVTIYVRRNRSFVSFEVELEIDSSAATKRAATVDVELRDAATQRLLAWSANSSATRTDSQGWVVRAALVVGDTNSWKSLVAPCLLPAVSGACTTAAAAPSLQLTLVHQAPHAVGSRTIPHPASYKLRFVSELATQEPNETVTSETDGVAFMSGVYLVEAQTLMACSISAAFPPGTFGIVSNGTCFVAQSPPTLAAALQRTRRQAPPVVVLPSAATGESIYGDDPPIPPMLYVTRLVAVSNIHGNGSSAEPVSRWFDPSKVSLVIHEYDMTTGRVLRGVMNTAVPLSDCRALDDNGFVVGCPVAGGVAESASYVLSAEPVDSFGKVDEAAYGANATRFDVSPLPTLTSLSWRRFTGFLNPLVASYDVVSRTDNVSLFLQGSFLWPTSPFFDSVRMRPTAAVGQLEDPCASLDGCQGWVTLSFRSLRGDTDDVLCSDVQILSATLLSCVVVGGLPQDAVNGTDLIAEVRSQRLFSEFRGVITLSLAPRPTILVSDASQPTSFTAAGCMLLQGLHLPYPPHLTSVTDAELYLHLGAEGGIPPLDIPLDVTVLSENSLSACLPVRPSLPFSGGGGAYAVAVTNGSTLRSGDGGFNIRVFDAANQWYQPLPDGVGVVPMPVSDFIEILGWSAANARTIADQALLRSLVEAPEEASPNITLRLLDYESEAPFLVMVLSRPLSLNDLLSSQVELIATDDVGQRYACKVETAFSRGSIAYGEGGDARSLLICRLTPWIGRTSATDLQLAVRLTLAPTEGEGEGGATISLPIPSAFFAHVNQPTNSSTSRCMVAVDGLPLLAGAPSYVTFTGAPLVAAGSLTFSTSSDCDAPQFQVPFQLLQRDTSTGSLTSVTVSFTTAFLGPLHLCIANGSTPSGLPHSDDEGSIDGITFWFEPEGWALLKSVIAVESVAFTTNGAVTRAAATLLGTHNDRNWTVDFFRDAHFPSLNLSISSFITLPLPDEDSVPFYASLGVAPIPRSHGDAHTGSSTWTACEASRTLVFGQADIISNGNRLFQYTNFDLVRDGLRLRTPASVAEFLLGNVGAWLCIAVSMDEMIPEATPTNRFVAVAGIFHENVSTAAPQTQHPATPAPPTPTSRCGSAVSSGDGVCNAPFGSCDEDRGECVCDNAHRGLHCELTCPFGPPDPAMPIWDVCSGHGSCTTSLDDTATTIRAKCVCVDGYSGGACQYIPPSDVVMLPQLSLTASSMITQPTPVDLQWVAIALPFQSVVTIPLNVSGHAAQIDMGAIITAKHDASELCNVPYAPSTSTGAGDVIVAELLLPLHSTDQKDEAAVTTRHPSAAVITNLWSRKASGAFVTFNMTTSLEGQAFLRVASPQWQSVSVGVDAASCVLRIGVAARCNAASGSVPPQYRRVSHVVNTTVRQCDARCRLVLVVAGLVATLLSLTAAVIGIQRRYPGSHLLEW